MVMYEVEELALDREILYPDAKQAYLYALALSECNNPHYFSNDFAAFQVDGLVRYGDTLLEMQDNLRELSGSMGRELSALTHLHVLLGIRISNTTPDIELMHLQGYPRYEELGKLVLEVLESGDTEKTYQLLTGRVSLAHFSRGANISAVEREMPYSDPKHAVLHAFVASSCGSSDIFATEFASFQVDGLVSHAPALIDIQNGLPDQDISAEAGTLSHFHTLIGIRASRHTASLENTFDLGTNTMKR